MDYLLVHGAWHGGWCWRRVADSLQARGHRVFSPSLTGLADRSHLLSPSLRLEDHVADVVNLANWEDLNGFVLCGHSYGGMVITGAASALAHRLKAIVYLDAFLPRPHQSLLDLSGAAVTAQILAQTAEAKTWLVPPVPAAALLVNEKDRAWVNAKCTAHPLATFRAILPEAIVAAHQRVERKFYVLATSYAVRSPTFVETADRCRKRPDWEVFDLPHGHDLMVDAPAAVADILLEAGA